MTVAIARGFAPLLLAASLVLAGSAGAADRYVDDDDVTCGGNSPCYSTITDALAAVAVDGETIEVAAGSYVENIVVDRAVNLLGAGAATTTLSSANGASEFLILLGANVPISFSQGMTISGFTFKGPLDGDEDLLMFRARSPDPNDPIVIENNIFDAEGDVAVKGIESRSGGDITNVEIKNNQFINNNRYAMFLNSAINWLIEGNTFDECWTGGLLINTSSADQTHDIQILDNSFDQSSIRPDAGTFLPNQFVAAIGLGSTCYNVDVINNQVTNSSGHGFTIGDRTTVALTGILLKCNNFVSNVGGALNELPANVILAENNWWGDATGPLNAATNPGGLGDPVTDGYDFDPWLAAASTGADCDALPPTEKWVDQAGGSDANDGDSEATAYATLQHAIDNSNPGNDTQQSIIHVKDGTYGQSGQISTCSGFETAIYILGLDYLTIQAVPGHEPVVKPLTAVEASIVSITIENSEHVVIDNIDSDQTIAQFDNWHTCNTNDLTVKNSLFEGGEDGIDFNTDQILALIDGNTFQDISTGSGDEVLDFTDATSADITIQDNTFLNNYRNLTVNPPGGSSASNFIIRRNYADGTNSQEAFRLISASDVLFENNAVLNCMQQALYIDSGCSNITVQHNSTFNNDLEGLGQGEIRTKVTSADIVIKNNVLYGSGANPAIETTVASLPGEDYNITFNTVDPGFTFGANTQAGVDPLYTSTGAGTEDLHLLAGSPAIAAGTALGVADDIEGSARPQPAATNPDLGAYESPLPPTPVHNIDTGTDYLTIQAGIDDPATLDGHTLVVDPGTYPENVVLDKSLTIQGAQSGNSACDRVPGAPDPATESIITGAAGTLLTLVSGSAGSVIDGFSLIGAVSGIASTSGPIDNVEILNNHFAEQTGSAIFLNDSGVDMTVSGNNVDGSFKTSGGGSVHLDTDSFLGFHFNDNCVVNGVLGTGFFVDGNHNVGPSAGRSPEFNGNLVDNHSANSGVNLGTRAFTGGTIDGNRVTNNAFDGIQGGIQNSTISNNLLDNNGRYGLRLTSFGNLGVDRGGQNNTVTGNTITNNASVGYQIDANQAAGNAASNSANFNDIVGNGIGARYEGTETIDVGCNWWGDIDGPDYPPISPNAPGDSLVATSATFTPWLDGSISGGGTPNCDQFPPVATTTVLTSDLNPSNCGEKVNLTATVDPSSATGTVEFFDSGASLGTAPLVAGVATLSTTTIGSGHRPLTAAYGGDADHLASSSNTLIQNVHCPGSLTTVTVTPCDSVDWYAANVRPGGTVDLSSTYPRSGAGSLEFNTADAVAKADWERINGNANLLSTLTALSVELYRNSSSTAAVHLAPAVRMLVWNGQPTDAFSLLIWEPVYNGVPVFPTDAWTSFDLLKQNFWQRAFKTTGGVTIEIFNRTLADWLAPGTVFDGGGNESNEVGPNAVVLAYNTGVGSGWTGTFAGAVDNFLIGFDTTDSLFNFEPELPTTVTLTADPAKSNWGEKVTLTATVTPSGATGTVEFSDQGGTPAYFEGFETDLGGDNGWDHAPPPDPFSATRVASGTNGVTSKDGDWHAEAATANGSAFTRWGGYNAVFPVGGYVTQICIWLDVTLAGTLGDTRFDWTSAINGSDGNHRRDFAFNVGTEASGFVISAGNNTGRPNANPADPGHDPVHITETGWYTFKHRFYNDGGVLACDMSIIASDGTVIVGGPAWTRKDASDTIDLIGGNRYGWFANQELPYLAFDNPRRTQASLGSAPVVNDQAVLSVTDLPVGLHDIVATFIPDGCYLASSSGKVPVEVNRGPATITLTSSPNPSASGTKALFTATLLPGDATGTVTFCQNGDDTLGVVAVAGGMAELSVDTLSNGSHPVVAKYSGDGCYLPVTSTVLVHVVEDQDDPMVTVISPNGGEVVFPTAPTKISWTATDNKNIASIDICLSRDNGATWEVIELGLPNTGTYTWIVTPPANNTGPDIVYSSLIQVKAHDDAGNIGDDISDDPFAIYDLATPTLISTFEAATVDGGIELRWQFVNYQVFEAVVLERGDSDAGPWQRLVGEVRVEDGLSIMVDDTAEPGRTYYYRLVGESGGQTVTFGPLPGTAGVSIRDFALSNVAPNPSSGPTHIEFAVPRAAPVRLSILDVQGREIAVLAEGRHRPGRYQATWTGRTSRGSVAAGMYFVRLKTPDRVVVRRIAITR